MTRSALYLGTVRHRRMIAPEREFAYPMWHVLLDLDEVDEVAQSIPFLSHNRFNLLSFDDRDHFGPSAVPVRAKLADWLAGRGVDLGDGRVEILTGLRLLGHGFDPVRFYFCRRADGDELTAVVAEVRSTFGESTAYLLPADGGEVVRAESDKRFHVSPFLEDHGTYRFRVTRPGDRLAIHIDLLQGGERVLDATLAGRRRRLTTGNLGRALLRWSGSGARTLARIHWQALLLWFRGAAFVPKPERPAEAWRFRHGHE